ncbi:response regulator [Roseiarcaceae bacterium H3SJ34-1]|uniref:response regulator n=1 Tax=Terripilifer ovatus TaxID=3032367 RepID=UPI003AB957C5|nr:response regulator [Roseiarcaceae bacterium H3SJ34-1]
MRSEQLLVVEDDFILRFDLVMTLEDEGYPVLSTCNADAAIALLNEQDIRAVISDVRMPGSMDGIGLAHTVQARWPHVPVLLMSGHVRPEEVPPSVHLFVKPISPRQLTTTIHRVLS